MNKVSITTSDGAHLIIEVQDPEVLYHVIGIVTGNKVSVPDTPHEEPYFEKDGAMNIYSNGNSANKHASEYELRNGTTNMEEQEFIDFCRESNPMGDMRKVVVVAEAASRYLNENMVDCDRLGELFDILGWHRPHSFIQTLRNSARSKFRWLERVPGRSGKYMVTEVGRITALARV
jgi:hypothetical protein